MNTSWPRLRASGTLAFAHLRTRTLTLALQRTRSLAKALTLRSDARAGWPSVGALRVDERLIDPDGPPAWISLVLPPPGVRFAFDDLSVQQARRLVLLHPFPAAVSTLLRDDSHFEGAITVARSPTEKHRLREDPFARIFPARLLAIEAGILGSTAPPTGPTIERCGSGNPWPWDRFG